MKRSIFSLAVLFLFAFATMVQAKEGKAVQKAKEAVSNAAPDDWMTYAESAEVLLKKNTSLNDVSEWLDKSIAVKESSYNLELKGDYYMATNLPKKAMEFYIKSIQKGKEESESYNLLEVQDKIRKVQASI